jgi:hypothetical protein
MKKFLSIFIMIAILLPGMAFAVSADEAEAAAVEEIDILALLGVTRMVSLTEEAQKIALEDFDFLADYILQTAPTQNIVYRRFGISMEEYLGYLRQNITDNVPIPSLAFLGLGDDWIEEPEDAVGLAADYLGSLLIFMSSELGGLGHLVPMDHFMYEQLYTAIKMMVNHQEEMLELGTPQAHLDFLKLHYDALSAPATLKLFGINPVDFDLGFDLDILMDVGAMDENNVIAVIIEENRIAYMHIASFFNSLALDIEVIYPFLYEIQDYEHLIIDIRGNMGGLGNYFLTLLMLILDEAIEFEYPEFYIESELTAGFYENPNSLMGATLAGVFDAKEFAEARNMTEYFDKDDLALLDKVLVWQTEFLPIPVEEGGLPFGGSIWLLVDGLSMSASEIAAQISVNTGFATVAGEPTAGVTGVIHTYISLPGTGILFRIDLGYTVDNLGRSIEEFGIIPQVANMPGLNALETVLVLIYSQDYILNNWAERYIFDALSYGLIGADTYFDFTADVTVEGFNSVRNGLYEILGIAASSDSNAPDAFMQRRAVIYDLYFAIHNFYNLTGIETDEWEKITSDGFANYDDALEYFIANGLINGRRDGNYQLDQICTVEEMIAFSVRAIEHIISKISVG